MFSCANNKAPRAISRRLLVPLENRAVSRTLLTVGIKIAAKIPMMAITVSSSISVKPRERRAAGMEREGADVADMVEKLAAVGPPGAGGPVNLGLDCQGKAPSPSLKQPTSQHRPQLAGETFR